MMKKVLLALVLSTSFAWSQTGSVKTQNQLNTEIGANSCANPGCLIPDQLQGQVTPFGMRQVLLDVTSTLFGVAATIPPPPYPVNNFIYTNSSSSLSFASIGTGLLLSGGTLSLPTVPINLGGTGQTTAINARGSSGLNIERATLVGDTNYTILATDRSLFTSTVYTAPRTWTLPDVTTVNPGTTITINDNGSITPTNTVTIVPFGAQSIFIRGLGSSSFVLNQVGQSAKLRAFGGAGWSLDISGIDNGGTGQTTAQGARSSASLNIDQVTTVGDANYIALATDRTIGYTVNFTAGHTLALPLSTTVNAGQRLRIITMGGGPNSAGNPLTINRNAGDSAGVNGFVVLTDNIELELITDGATGWFLGRRPLAAGGTGANSAMFARQSAGLNVLGDSGQGFGDANQNPICSTTRMAWTTTTLTAVRTWTLPAANLTTAPYACLILDMAGAVNGANTLTISRAGADTINAGGTSVSITSATNGFICHSDGTSKWSCEALGAAGGGGGGTVTQITCNNGLTGGVIVNTGTCQLDINHVNAWTADQRFGTSDPWCDVKEKGAAGLNNPATDDSVPIQACFTQLAATGGIVYVPPGNYCISNTIVMPGLHTPSGQFIFQGAGEQSSLLSCGHDVTILKNENFRSIVRDMNFHGSDVIGTVKPTIVLDSVVNAGQTDIPEESRWYNLQITGGSFAFDMQFNGEIEIWQTKMLQSYGTALVHLAGGAYLERVQLDQNWPDSQPGVHALGTGAPAWAANTGYNRGQIVTCSGFYLQAVVGTGTAPNNKSAAAGPCPTLAAYGVNITDNQVVWQIAAPTSYRAITVEGQPNFFLHLDITGMFSEAIRASGVNANQLVIRDSIIENFFDNGFVSVDANQGHTLDGNLFGNCLKTTCNGIAIGNNSNGGAIISNNTFTGLSTGISLFLNGCCGGNLLGNKMGGITVDGIAVSNGTINTTITGNSPGFIQGFGGASNTAIHTYAGGSVNFYFIIGNICNGSPGGFVDGATGPNRNVNNACL